MASLYSFGSPPPSMGHRLPCLLRNLEEPLYILHQIASASQSFPMGQLPRLSLFFSIFTELPQLLWEVVVTVYLLDTRTQADHSCQDDKWQSQSLDLRLFGSKSRHLTTQEWRFFFSWKNGTRFKGIIMKTAGMCECRKR